MTIDQLDVRTIPQAQRHDLIFEQLEKLSVGEALRLTIDHDPQPLRCQLDAAHPGRYRWEVLESGPEEWVIDITKSAHVFDARPILAKGEEPFNLIMDAAEKVREGELFMVYAPFEPVPLEGVLGEQGFDYFADPIDNTTDWRVTFVRR